MTNKNMDEIILEFRSLYDAITSNEIAFSFRRRFNEHHPQEVITEETKIHNRNQQALFIRLKKLFLDNREEMLKSNHLNKHDRDCMEALDQCVAADMEEAFGLAKDSNS